MQTVVGLIARDVYKREVVAVAMRSSSAIRILFERADLKDLMEPNPDVLLLGLTRLTRKSINDPWWSDLIQYHAHTPMVRLAVWFDALEPGAFQDLVSLGVRGVAQWVDAIPATWPRLAQVVHAGASYWTRPFDLGD